MLEPPPEVQQGLEIYMEAFWDLCSDRYEAGHRIPWVARQGWCEAHGILDQDDQADFHFLVTRLDVTFLLWLQKKTPKKTETGRHEPRGLRTTDD